MAVSGLQNVSTFAPSLFEIGNRGFTASETENDDNNSIISEQSSDLGEIERERVRQIFQEWMNSGAKGHSNYEFRLKNRSGPQWLGENECERVRIVREWVQMNTKQMNNHGSLRDGFAEVGNRIEQVRDGLEIPYTDIGVRRPIRKLCGRQTLLDLLLRAQSDRKRELHGLSEQRPVSGFAHRNRIQALLRGRFLRNERLILNERPSSVAATELGLLRQRLTVSDLREGFLSKLDNSVSNSVNNDESDSSSTDENYDGNSAVHITSDSESTADENRSLQEFVVQANPILDNDETEQDVLLEENINDVSIINESENVNRYAPLEIYHENYVDEVNGQTNELERNMNEEFDWQENEAEEFLDSAIEIGDGVWQELNSVLFIEWANAEEQDQMQESHEDWPSNSQDLQEAIDSWLDMPSGEVGSSIGRLDTFYFPDEDNNVHSMELRELSSRRRVSGLLRSSFRESLDQVLQSLVERQGHPSGDSEPDNVFSSRLLIEQDEEQLGGDQILALYDDNGRNPFAPSSTLVAGYPPLWNEEFQGVNWPHNSNMQMGTEWEVISGLRIEMARLNQSMNNMESMLEAFIDMQIELQRSVRQEISAALNRSSFSGDASEENRLDDELQWDHIRKGICCMCRDSKIDSLLYRCGHMCTCSKCAENLVQCMGKCPMCRAPAIEVVRAYFIQ
ncbi:hypothetical protein BUALT_Bualt13G0067400 [Buddleja alternifolia]|uniref:RING-type domain-containing protein n=1 Tax=Buddleja alternifolia TaxID=168488 RepID=A0AAV6WW96_9LAMI|nr:hypothetical protein BUALT_Bualt13G0067400 [Buddleja alternifolia]